MRKTRMVAVGVALVGIVFGAGAATSATFNHAHVGPASPLQRHQPAFQVTSGQEKLKNSLVVTGNANETLTPGDYTPIDSGETITCPKKGTCTLEADMSVQGLGTGQGDNWWSICFVVDSSVNATCPYYGLLDASFFDVGTQIESVSGLAPGPHTVQTKVYSTNGGWAYNYDLTYHAYTP